ncbi:TAT-dependent nitrous-oxide reductase [Halorubrum sp. AD140]|uniref:TAT-dependent nitrous-oxide reductase n=1 Tax=Halorubrum sp. AD140 TaxID=3050073 RepID=UPI002ACD17CA|nr:TAT-dependent nitrous-oxide reductase [Halorubrum sp. AD140]MDZ5812572.1 TAT-dependent nitrous-oxide reductase [Halorubrum sp. AD140]
MTTHPNESDERTERTDEHDDAESGEPTAADEEGAAAAADDEPEIVDGRTIEHLLTDHERDIAATAKGTDATAAKRPTLDLPRLELGRRDFMKAGAVAGAMGSLAGCTSILADEDGEDDGGAAASGDHTVPPGEHDEYYGFLSGGHTGEIRVVGLPSMRELMRIPVFQAESARGFGHDARTSELLEEAGGYTWGDTHHPRVSQTDNDYDGRWLFVNDKANGRMARVDLKYFETDAITNVPNCQGVHGACMQLPDTQLVFGVGEFRVPMPNDGRDVDDPDEYGSVLTAIDPETMDIEWQVQVDGNMDNGDGGKEGRWFFATGYNSEEGVTEAEMTRSDRDYVKAFDIPAIWDAVENGDYEEISGVPVVDGRKESSLNQGDRPIVRYVATPKSPHGISVTPDGKYAIASGKLDPSCTVIGVEEIAEVDDPQDAILGQPRIGMGPLHTAYDDRGHAYTTCFIDSVVVKWDYEEAVEAEAGSEEPVIERHDVHYNPGHLIAAESYTASPQGDYLISLNKLSKDRFLPVGPIHPENDQLFYIGDDDAGMQLIKDKPSYPEPHDASVVHKDKIEPAKTWDPDDYELDFVEEGDESFERVDENTVEIEMWARRNEFAFPEVELREGDEVTIRISNVETTSDVIHSLAIPEYDINLALAPQDTREVTFTADEPGVFWAYCAYFCSALHLEMRSRILVQPDE